MSAKKQNQAKQRRSTNRQSEEARQAAKLARKHAEYRRQWRDTFLGLGGAALIGFGVYGAANAGSILSGDIHKAIVAETEHCQVNAAMLAFYYQEHVDSYLTYADSYPDAACFDREQSLKQQYFDETQGQTWYDYLMTTTMNTVQTTLRGCEAAYAAGYTLPEDVQAEIEEDAAAIDLSHYQPGLTREEVKQVMTLQMTARHYEQSVYQAVSVTDEEIEAEAKANPQDYEMFSMLCFTFDWEDGDAEGEQAARNHAEALAACGTPEEFLQYAKTYMEQKGLSEKDIEQRMMAMRMTSGYDSYNEDVYDWMQTAKPNATFTLDGSQARYMEVLMLETEPALDTSDCVDLRVIYLSGSAEQTEPQAESIVQECKDAGSTPEAFASLVQQYSGNMTAAANGGLVEGYSRIRTTYGAETAEWAFEAGRKQGDMFICMRENAAIIAYYEGTNARCGWENQVYAALLQQKNEAISEELTGTEVTLHEENQKLVTG